MEGKIYTKSEIKDCEVDPVNFVSMEDYLSLQHKLEISQRLLRADMPSMVRMLNHLFGEDEPIKAYIHEHRVELQKRDKDIDCAKIYIGELLRSSRKIDKKFKYPAAESWLREEK